MISKASTEMPVSAQKDKKKSVKKQTGDQLKAHLSWPKASKILRKVIMSF